MEAVTLEDNKEYVILDTIEIDGIKYLYLAHLSDPEKRTACIRKLVDNNINIAGLDTEEEYNKALNAYIEKYKDIVVSA